jgi:3-carboxy-cis,cis-muconate cycloisomerase
MRANLDRAGGQSMAEALATALAPHLGRPEAQRIVRQVAEHAAREGATLRQAAETDDQVRGVLSGEALAVVFDPASYLGSTETYVARALADFYALRRGASEEARHE